MARQTFEDWIPEEYGGAVVTKVQQMSAIEAHARREPMTSDVKNVPRSGGMSFGGAIGKGLAYTEDGATNDDVTLTALKFGRAMRVADEDLKDTANVVNIIQTKQLDWARAYAVGFDQACLGTSAAANGTTVPFLSLYQALNTTNSAVGYTADDHVVATSAGVAPTYANLSDVFGKVEESGYWVDGEMLVIAHPSFRAKLRNITGTLTYYDGVDEATASDGRPVFVEAASQALGTPDTLFGVPIAWSLGAKTNATASDAPSGSPLLFVGNRNFLIKGERSPIEYMLAGADTGAAFLTDEALLKVRVRRGFAVANENAWAVLEAVPSA